MKKILYQSCMIFCAIYTANTIIASIIVLAWDRAFVSNYEYQALNMAISVFIIVCAVQMLQYANFKYKALNIIVPFCVYTGLLLIIDLVTSFFRDPSNYYVEFYSFAYYRNILLAYTIMFAIITAAVKIIKLVKNKKRTARGNPK